MPRGRQCFPGYGRGGGDQNEEGIAAGGRHREIRSLALSIWLVGIPRVRFANRSIPGTGFTMAANLTPTPSRSRPCTRVLTGPHKSFPCPTPFGVDSVLWDLRPRVCAHGISPPREILRAQTRGYWIKPLRGKRANVQRSTLTATGNWPPVVDNLPKFRRVHPRSLAVWSCPIPLLWMVLLGFVPPFVCHSPISLRAVLACQTGGG